MYNFSYRYKVAVEMQTLKIFNRIKLSRLLLIDQLKRKRNIHDMSNTWTFNPLIDPIYSRIRFITNQ